MKNYDLQNSRKVLIDQLKTEYCQSCEANNELQTQLDLKAKKMEMYEVELQTQIDLVKEKDHIIEGF